MSLFIRSGGRRGETSAHDPVEITSSIDPSIRSTCCLVNNRSVGARGSQGQRWLVVVWSCRYEGRGKNERDERRAHHGR